MINAPAYGPAKRLPGDGRLRRGELAGLRRVHRLAHHRPRRSVRGPEGSDASMATLRCRRARQGRRRGGCAHRPEGLAGDAPLLVVADTFPALARPGPGGPRTLEARIVGVTGSVGKTGVKEALRLVLGRQAHACKCGQLEQPLGVPLSLARMAPRARFAVFEMGMNHAGEIAPLTRQVRPHVCA